MPYKKFHFTNKKNERLSARIDLPDARPTVAYGIFAHCFTCTKNFKAAATISGLLADAGMAVLRFDFTGLGESEGDFSETTFSTTVDDIIAAADFLEKNFRAPEFLIGHSLGGTAVLQASAAIPSSKTIVTIGAPDSPEHVFRIIGRSRQKIETDGEAVVTLAGRNFQLKREFLDDLIQPQTRDTLKRLKKALLIFHSPFDDVVGIDSAARIYRAARHPKSFVSLDRADHLLSDAEDRRFVGTMTAAWLSKYVGFSHGTESISTDDRIHVKAGATGYTTEITARNHRLLADEPVEAGGADAGPTPYDLLAAGLGACTAMTLRMYADRKGWPLEEILVDLKHEKIHAQDCEVCQTKEGKVDEIMREIELVGPLDDPQRQRLLQIADRCPVHRSLQSEISINTRLKPQSAGSAWNLDEPVEG